MIRSWQLTLFALLLMLLARSSTNSASNGESPPRPQDTKVVILSEAKPQRAVCRLTANLSR
jgi:hypothetical protein